MQIDMTQRATIAAQQADGELKQRLEALFRMLESGGELSGEHVRKSPSRPDVYIVKLDDYRVFFQRGDNAIHILDIVQCMEAYL